MGLKKSVQEKNAPLQRGIQHGRMQDPRTVPFPKGLREGQLREQLRILLTGVHRINAAKSGSVIESYGAEVSVAAFRGETGRLRLFRELPNGSGRHWTWLNKISRTLAMYRNFIGVRFVFAVDFERHLIMSFRMKPNMNLHRICTGFDRHGPNQVPKRYGRLVITFPSGSTDHGRSRHFQVGYPGKNPFPVH
ncbi:hypothetical protein CJP46_07570 [Paenibacillus sp. XY044]|nr:hypothetical protein CJP46_07570 [Paenibacillus sp. XY044]